MSENKEEVECKPDEETEVVKENRAVIFDTETTKMIEWKQPSGSECQPHLSSIAAVLVDLDTRKVISTLDFIVRNDGWELHPEALAVHGITIEQSIADGITEKEAFEKFIELCGDHKRVCFNRTFDQRIIRIAAKRYASEEVQTKWAEKDNFDCAMMMARKIIGGKQPKLIDALKYFTGENLVNAHSALPDTEACMQVYWGCLDAEKTHD